MNAGPALTSRSHVQALCVQFKLQNLVASTPHGDSKATRPARKSHTVTVPEVRPQLSRQFSSANSSREISSLDEVPIIQQHWN